jgi:hypothetical protein
MRQGRPTSGPAFWSFFAVVRAQLPAGLVAAPTAILSPEVVACALAAAVVDHIREAVGHHPVTAPRGAVHRRGFGVDPVQQCARTESMIMVGSAGHHRPLGHLHPPRTGLVRLAHTGTFRLRDAPGWGCHEQRRTVITSAVARDVRTGTPAANTFTSDDTLGYSGHEASPRGRLDQADVRVTS